MEPSEQKQTGFFWLLIILVLIGFAAAAMFFERGNKDLVAAIQSPVSRPTPSRQARVYTVYYGLGIFSPTNIRIHVGDSVRFQNDSDFPISIVSDRTNGLPDLAGFDSIGDVPPGSAFSFTFSEAGIFGYHNGKDPAEEGTVIVRP
jgi:plastocyanin